MKTTKKIIGVLLAVIMVFSCTSVAFAGVLNTNSASAVSGVISSSGLSGIVDKLLPVLDSTKDNYIGTVLKIVCLVIDNDTNKVAEKKAEAQGLGYTYYAMPEIIGTTDLSKVTDDKIPANFFVNWLNKNLPYWFKDVTEQEVYKTLTKYINVDISSVSGLLKTVNALKSFILADILNIFGKSPDSIKWTYITNAYNCSTSNDNLGLIKNLVSFLNDNRDLLKSALSGKLDLGVLNDAIKIDDVNYCLKNIGTLLTSAIYKVIDKDAGIGKFEKDKLAGDWGKSAYKDFTADELLFAVLYHFIHNDGDHIVTKDEIKDYKDKSFYQLISENVGALFENYLCNATFSQKQNASNTKDLINTFAGFIVDAIDSACGTAAGVTVFNKDVIFTASDFTEVFNQAKTDKSILKQVNRILYVMDKKLMTAAEFNKLGLVDGGNENLNANIVKIARYALPFMSKSGTINGISVSAYSDVENLSDEQAVAAVLKVFFGSWFGGDKKATEYSINDINNANSLGQLGALAMYYTFTNENWLNLKGVDKDKTSAKNKIASIGSFSNDEALSFAIDCAGATGVGALLYNADTIKDKIKLDVNTLDHSSWQNCLDSLAKWGLNFIKGLPAVANSAKLLTDTNSYNDGIYKLNVILNELIDFSFLNNVSGKTLTGETTFKLDLYALLNNVLGLAFNGDIAGVLGIFENNGNTSNLLGGKFVPSVLGAADRFVTALFSHSCSASGKVIDCAAGYTYTYDKNNGHYMTYTKGAAHSFAKTGTKVAPTCAAAGTDVYTCSRCKKATEDRTVSKLSACNEETIKFTKTVAPTCDADGYSVYTCSVCKKTYNRDTKAKLGHDYSVFSKTKKAPTCKDGGTDIYKCSRCSSTTEKNTVKLSECKPETIVRTVIKPTCQSIGFTEYKCSVCGKTTTPREEAKAKIPHNFVNGKCTMCGVSDGSTPSGGSTQSGGTTTPTTPDKKIMLGNLNPDKDDLITVEDARSALRIAVKLDTPTDEQKIAGDVNGDKSVTVEDARLILRVAVKLDDAKNFPANK